MPRTASAQTSATQKWSLADRLREAFSKPREWIEPAIGGGSSGNCKTLDRAGSLLCPQIVGARRFLLDEAVAALVASIGDLLDPLDEGRTSNGLDWDDPYSSGYGIIVN
jgi:hypothetical protein